MLDRSLFSDILGQEAIYSAVFVGSTKGRNVLISTLQEQLTALGLNTLFYVHEQNSTVTTSGNETQQKLIPYEEYVALIGKSEAIIDIVNESNYGLTVRPLEALFAKKKLITNYSEIVHYDFYHEDNIFIFDKSNIDQIPAWLEKPYHPIDEAILVRYDIDAWLDRFEHRSINE